MMNSGPKMVMVCVSCGVLDLWSRLGAKTGEFFRLLSHNPPCQWPNDPKNYLQIHFTSSQWIQRIMTNSAGPERWSSGLWGPWGVGFVADTWGKNRKQVRFSNF
jgi:hypothetical protein